VDVGGIHWCWSEAEASLTAARTIEKARRCIRVFGVSECLYEGRIYSLRLRE
jgi:hypothetical protein